MDHSTDSILRKPLDDMPDRRVRAAALIARMLRGCSPHRFLAFRRGSMVGDGLAALHASGALSVSILNRPASEPLLYARIIKLRGRKG